MDLLATKKDSGLTGGSLSRQQAEYYYKGYPYNDAKAKVAAQQIIRNGVFASFVRSNEDWLQFTNPGNHESYQLEWETVENMKVHYENVERHMLAVVITEVNPNYDLEIKAADVNDVDHQSILIKESEQHRVHSFDEAGWSADIMDAGNEKIIAGLGEFMPTVYSTKSIRRVTFVGGSIMDGTELPQFTILPVRPEASWVTGEPKFWKLGDDGQPLKARFDANELGGMTNATMEKYFWSVINPSSKGMENETGKRHVWLSDSAGAHMCLPFLKLMRDHGRIFVPRTLYLSHQEQNEDIVHFSEFKRMESRERQAIQTVLITADWRTLARQSHSDRTLGIHHMQQCTARPWEKAFDEWLCIRAWGKGG